MKISKRLLLYFILAVGITWLFWIPTIIISLINDYFLPSILTFNQLILEGFVDDLHQLVFILNQIGVYGPMIAAFLILFITEKKKGVIDLLKRMGKVKISLKWYGYIIILPMFIFLLGSLLSFTDLTNLFNPGMSAILIFIMFLNTTFTSGLEEPGWRGFGLEELQNSYNANKSSLILGLVWAIWHFPYLIYLYLFQFDFGIYLSVLSLVGYIASTMGVSIIYTWMYNNTKSVFLMILFHSLLNFIPQVMLGGVTNSAGGVFTALVTWGIAIILTKKYGEETLTELTQDEIKAKEEKKRIKAEKKSK